MISASSDFHRSHSMHAANHAIARVLLIGIPDPSVCHLLQLHGYDCTTVEQLIEYRSGAHQVDLVLMDQSLSWNDTNALLEEITNEANRPAVAICCKSHRNFEKALLKSGRANSFEVLYYDEIENGLFLKRIDTWISYRQLRRSQSMGNEHRQEHQRLTRELALHAHAADHERELNANILSSVGFGIVICDPSGTIMLLNGPAGDFLDCKGTKALGAHYTQFLPKSLVRSIEPYFSASNQKISDVQRLKIGTRHLQLSAYTMFNSRQRPNGLLVFLQDITKQEEMQLHLYRSEKLATMGTMISGISHELRNPLSIISARCQMTLAKLPSENDKVRHALESIQSQTERCAHIVNGILDFTRQGTSGFSYHKASDILEEALSYVQYQNSFDEMVIEKTFDPGAEVFGDRSRYVQVFVNLFTNAADAMEGRGNLSLCSQSTTPSETLITVTDNGPGIPSEYKDRILDPFFTTKDPGKGTGLGLAIVHKIINESGGRLAYTSGSGATTFSVYLPSSKRKQ